MTVSQFPPQPKTLAKARKYIQDKREQVSGSREARTNMLEAMWGSIATTLGDMGVSSVVVGDEHIDITQAQGRHPIEEARWTQAINEGKFVGVIQAGNIAMMSYRGDKKVNMDDRSLAELIDEDMVRQLAPTAVIYAAGAATPWPDLISNIGFSIWLDDRAQFDAVWARVKDWMKTAWHDQTLQKLYPQDHTRSDHTFVAAATTNIAPDLTFRQAKYERAKAKNAQADEMSAWDQLGQQEIKKLIGSLLQLEDHPQMGALVPAWLDQLTPMLAHAMEGKDRTKRLQEDERKAWSHLYGGFSTQVVRWADLPAQAPANPNEGRMGVRRNPSR